VSKDKKKKADDGLSKKERKALAEREAALAAELAGREAKAAKKGKKAKGKKKADVHIPAAVLDVNPRPDAALAVEDDFDRAQAANNITPQQVINAADKVIGTKGSAPESIKKAREAKARAEAELAGAPAPSADDDDAAIKARVTAKRTRRELIAAAPAALEALDRSDKAAVDVYNDTYGKATGSYATSTEELEGQVTKVKGVAPTQSTPPEPYTLTDDEVDGGDASMFEPSVIEHATAAVDAVEQVVEEVETERGRVFEAGASIGEGNTINGHAFVQPSDAPPEVEVGRNGYKITTPDGKKELQYTRVTTFIKLIEDRSTLEKWSKRKLLEGVVVDQAPDENGNVADRLGTIRDLIHNRDVAIAKARKADLAELVTAAEMACKDGINVLIEELEELGGGKDAANKGTELHTLTELHDKEGLEAVAQLLTDGKITPADFADIEAYSRAVKAAGLKFTNIEKFVVDDERKVAGRLDRTAMVRFPGSKRAVHAVGDVKTGSIDYGISLPLQLENYATMKGYDPARPTEREDLKLNRLKGFVIHLPQGTGTCFIYPVDLATGRLGNRITAEGRAFRNAGKKAIDKTVDMGDADAVAAYNASLEAAE
jgi:hypothetical protein